MNPQVVLEFSAPSSVPQRGERLEIELVINHAYNDETFLKIPKLQDMENS